MSLPPLPSRHISLPRRGPGYVKRAKALWEQGPVGPWHATVKVVPLEGMSDGVHFEVVTSWLGPPAPGFPPSADPVDTTIPYDVKPSEGPDFARLLAQMALDDLRIGEIPDLAAHAQRLKEHR